MSSISVEELLAEISPEEPSGPNMEYDAAYMAVERIAKGKPERQMGDEVLPAEDPDWRRLKEESEALLKKTKDLRLCLYLALGLMKLEGLIGLRDGLKVFHGLVTQFWDTFHPELDPEDDNDPTQRVNIIDSIGQPPDVSDPMSFQAKLREIFLCDSRQVGRFSIRDIEIATGAVAATDDPETPPADLATIEAAFMDTDLDTLTAAAEAINESVELVEEIETVLTEKVGAGNATDLSGCVKILGEIRKVLSEYLAKRGAAVPGEEELEEGQEGSDGEGGGRGPALSGEVRNRQDVLNAIDKLFKYYATYEPSSPVPVLLKRARRLAVMDFMEIIADLSPDALPQIQVISGVDSETEGS